MYSLDRINRIFQEIIDNFLIFLNTNEEYKNKVSFIREEYSLKNDNEFNIFTSLSKHYYKENLHSDILKLIFDPSTKKIGNYEYLKVFIKFINKTLKTNIELDYKNVVVEREKDRIDIFIHDDKLGVIVENKINNAPDRENQIGKYYKRSIDNSIDIKAIVYLTLSPEKKLDRKYSIKDTENKKAIEAILIELPVINKQGEKSFVNDILKKCILLAKNELSKMYLSEYARLLECLGGDFMLKDLNEKALYNIFKEKKALKDFKVFGYLWDKQKDFLGNVFKEYFQNELNFETHPEDYDWVYKTIKPGVNIGFATDYSFGFVSTPNSKINSNNKKIFKKILENESLRKYLKEDKADEDGYWVYKRIAYEKINSFNDLKELVEIFENIIKEKM